LNILLSFLTTYWMPNWMLVLYYRWINILFHFFKCWLVGKCLILFIYRQNINLQLTYLILRICLNSTFLWIFHYRLYIICPRTGCQDRDRVDLCSSFFSHFQLCFWAQFVSIVQIRLKNWIGSLCYFLFSDNYFTSLCLK